MSRTSSSAVTSSCPAPASAAAGRDEHVQHAVVLLRDAGHLIGAAPGVVQPAGQLERHLQPGAEPEERRQLGLLGPGPGGRRPGAELRDDAAAQGERAVHVGDGDRVVGAAGHLEGERRRRRARGRATLPARPARPPRPAPGARRAGRRGRGRRGRVGPGTGDEHEFEGVGASGASTASCSSRTRTRSATAEAGTSSGPTQSAYQAPRCTACWLTASASAALPGGNTAASSTSPRSSTGVVVGMRHNLSRAAPAPRRRDQRAESSGRGVRAASSTREFSRVPRRWASRTRARARRMVDDGTSGSPRAATSRSSVLLLPVDASIVPRQEGEVHRVCARCAAPSCCPSRIRAIRRARPRSSSLPRSDSMRSASSSSPICRSTSVGR